MKCDMMGVVPISIEDALMLYLIAVDIIIVRHKCILFSVL